MDNKTIVFLLLVVLFISCDNKKEVISTPKFHGTYVPASKKEVDNARLYTNNGVITDEAAIRGSITSVNKYFDSIAAIFHVTPINYLDYFYFNTATAPLLSNDSAIIALTFENDQKVLCTYKDVTGSFVTKEGIVQAINKQMYYLRSADSLLNTTSLPGFPYLSPYFMYYNEVAPIFDYHTYNKYKKDNIQYSFAFYLEIRNGQFVIPYMTTTGRTPADGNWWLDNDHPTEKNSDDAIIASLHAGDSVVCQLQYVALIKQ